MTVSREALLAAAREFCNAFASNKPLDDILCHFSQSTDPLCIEHGLPQLAPFLGRKFTGLNGVKDYFSIIADLLSYDDMHFDDADYFVDIEKSMVSVKGRATFTWKSTGNSWPEVFTYRLEFNDDLKVRVYEVWADSGAAYLASKGQLT